MIAAFAAERGARVVLLEKDRFPRDKVCGEFLSAEGCAVLSRAGLLEAIRTAGAVPIEGCLLADSAGRTAASPLPDVASAGFRALGISRAVLDETILRHAASRGVDVRESVVATRPILEGGRVVGVTARPAGSRDGHEPYVAPLVIAADGRRSMLQRALHPDLGDPTATTRRSWFGLKAHLPDRTGGLDRRIELYVFQGGYAGLGPIEGDRLDLGLIARVDALRACGGSPQRLFEERMLANPALRSRLSGAAPCSAWKTVGPLRFNVRAPASHGALFLGDAAGTIDPFAGEGMSNALAGAEMALPFVRAAIERGTLTDEAARDWTRAWRAAFAPVTRRARVLGRVFQHPRPASWAMSLLRLPAGARMLPGLVAASRTGA